MNPQRRRFLSRAAAICVASPLLPLLAACAPRISQKVYDAANGSPWRCSHCGHLTRSHDDISGHRCPRCGRRRLAGISEEELAQRLNKG